MTKPSILIIDDSSANLKLLTVLLSTDGFHITTAYSAADALADLALLHPDLILTDLQLPDLHGLDLTRRLKADPRLRSIPVVAVTAYARSGDRERALDAGCVAYVSKPIDTRSLPKMLKGLLAEAGGKAA